MTSRKGRWSARLVGLGLTLLFYGAMTSHLPLVEQMVGRAEVVAYDARLNLTLAEAAVDPRVVIIDIDERSLTSEGHWPWPRDRIATLIENLFTAGVAVVAFDIVFPENEANRALEVARRLDGRVDRDVIRLLHAQSAQFNHDAMLASVLGQHDTVLGFTLQSSRENRSGALPAPLNFDADSNIAAVTIPEADGFVANNDTLQTPHQRAGFFSLDMVPDPDGIIRRVPLVMRHDGAVYPALALETARLFLLLDKVAAVSVIDREQRVLESLQLGDITIPTDRLGRIAVPFRGKQRSFPYLSATDVLNTPTALPSLDGTIALIGTTATGLNDLRSTPVEARYPGVEVHANVIAAILDNRFPAEPSWAEGANILLLLLLGITLALLLPALPPLGMLMVSIAIALLVVVGNLWAWQAQGIILALSLPLALIGSLNAFNMTYGFLTESRSRRQLKEMFGQYVPPQLVEEMSRHPGDFSFEGESREMTVLFSDVRSFTTISEGLSAARLKEMLNRFFTPMTELIFKNRGTIDKYVGDMVMAFWGAPVQDDDHAYHAVVTAMAMIDASERLKPLFRQQGFPELNIGIGINTGLMNVGDMGSVYRRAYTVIGDAVNLASRLEGATKFYGVTILAGEAVYEKSADRILYRELDLIRVKGKQQAVRIYQPICLRAQATAEQFAEMEQWHQALAHYRQANWAMAREMFEALRSSNDATRLAEVYLERIASLAETTLAEEWDGVFTRESK